MPSPAHKTETRPLRKGGVYTKTADGSVKFTAGTIQRGTPEHQAALEALEKAAAKKPAAKKETDK